MVDFSETITNNECKLHIANGLVKKTKAFRIDLDDDSLTNSHILLSGGSGTGKTTLLKRILDYQRSRDKVIIVIDFHGDMDIEDENLIEFTPTDSPNAINPFELELDPKKGGVDIQAESITLMLGTYFFDKGRITKKQENTLEKLIKDTYGARGIFQNDKETWTKTPPTMKDLYLIFTFILSGGSSGGSDANDSNAERLLDAVSELVAMLLQKDNEEAKSYGQKLFIMSGYIKDVLEEDEDNDYQNKEEDPFFDSGLDFSHIDLDYYMQKSNYKTLETLFSYIEKVANLSIFNGKAPVLKKGINRIDMSAFTSIGKPLTAKFLGEFIAQKFFRASMIRGEYSKLENTGKNKKCDRVLVFDESKLALPTGMEKENAYNIMNRIVTESRKYGLALILASQRLNHYSEEILSNIHTKILLGAKSNDYKNVARVFGVKEDTVKNTFSYSNKRTALIEIGGECDVYEMLNFTEYKK